MDGCKKSIIEEDDTKIPYVLLNSFDSHATISAWYKDKPYYGVVISEHIKKAKHGSFSEIKNCLMFKDFDCLKPIPRTTFEGRSKRHRKVKPYLVEKNGNLKNNIKNGKYNKKPKIPKIDTTLEILKNMQPELCGNLKYNSNINEISDDFVDKIVQVGLSLSYCETKNSETNINGIQICPMSLNKIYELIDRITHVYKI
ncbi:hypothetical protein HZS_3473 [Henneguya salminicola]|nr:hypothetical protein HZS_3473 [Henneguya salminicola]